MKADQNIFEMTEQEIREDHDCTVMIKRKGQRIRWFDLRTGYYHPGWWPLFVKVPNDVDLTGLTSNDFGKLARENGWPAR